MKIKFIKRKIACIALAVVCAVSTLLPIQTAQAAQNVEEEWLSSRCGLEEFTFDADYNWSDDNSEEEPLVQREAAVDAYWQKFSSDYYYNQLTAAEKELWDRLESSCLDLIQGDTYAEGAEVSCGDLNITTERAGEVAFMFKYSNPQYYFLQTGWAGSQNSSGIVVRIAIRLYDDFCNGAARLAATKAFDSKISTWVAEVAKGERAEDKEKIAHDIICNNTIYNGSSTFNQSAYSMVCEGKTVCAGYAAAMQLLMNAVGIETIEITSETHGWNAIKLHGEWYLVDVTWDDQNDKGGSIYYAYYNKAEKTDTDHTAKERWEGLVPEQPYDSTDSYYNYSSAYTTLGNYVYFLVNSNTEKGNLLAKVVDVIDAASDEAIPGTIEIGGKTYTVMEETSIDPETTPAPAPTTEPTTAPTTEPTTAPTTEPTTAPTTVPTTAPTTAPTTEPTTEPTTVPTTEPTTVPTTAPTATPNPVESFASRMYTVVLDRSADPVGLADWTNWLLSHEVDGAGIAEGFIMSKEFLAKNVSNEEYINILYRTFFDREADAEGRNTWATLLDNGTSKRFVLAGFVNSNEFDVLCKQYGIDRGTMSADENSGNVTQETGIRGFVERLYSNVLGRVSDESGMSTWADGIANGTFTAEEVAKMFFASEEFLARGTSDEEYVETLYQTFMGRNADAGGKALWLDQLNGKMDRTQVLEGFSRSEEFKKILESFGL